MFCRCRVCGPWSSGTGYLSRLQFSSLLLTGLEQINVTWHEVEQVFMTLELEENESVSLKAILQHHNIHKMFVGGERKKERLDIKRLLEHRKRQLTREEESQAEWVAVRRAKAESRRQKEQWNMSARGDLGNATRRRLTGGLHLQDEDRRLFTVHPTTVSNCIYLERADSRVLHKFLKFRPIAAAQADSRSPHRLQKPPQISEAPTDSRIPTDSRSSRRFHKLSLTHRNQHPAELRLHRSGVI